MGKTEFSVRISHDALELLASVDEHPFIMVPCPYAGLGWRGCANILFKSHEPLDDRGNITVLYIQIYSNMFFNLFLLNCLMKLSNYCCVLTYIFYTLGYLMLMRCHHHKMIQVQIMMTIRRWQMMRIKLV